MPTTPTTIPRILWVDDNADAADTAAMLLGLFGCNARACYDGRSALAAAAEFRPHACFLDLNMPGMDGDELAVRLRAQANGRPLLLVCVTAQGGPETVARVRAAGFHLHLVKPVAPSDLSIVVRGLAPAVRPAETTVGV
jgi:CheY-like chemotaxis protein